MDPRGMKDGRIVSIQALRLLAALAVAGMHAEIFAYWLGRFRNVNMDRPGWIGAGNFGVDVFFAISGFVIVLSSRHLFGQPRAARGFLTRRLIR
ncbi:MAG: acyltransferase family protein, partial [Novosphingobium sp.]